MTDTASPPTDNLDLGTGNVEGKPQEPPKEPEKPEIKPSADAWAAIARKEKALLKDKQSASERAKALEAKEARIKAWEDKVAQAKLDPTKWLEEGGITYEDVSKHILKGGPSADDKIEAIRQQLEADRQERIESEKTAKEQAKKDAEKRNQQAVQTFVGQIHGFVNANKDEYDVIHLLGAQELVYKGIEETHQKTGKTPTIKEAADGVQEFLVGKLDTIIPKLKWFQEKYSQGQTPKAPEPTSKTTETLSNSMSPGMNNMSGSTDEERTRKALEALDKFS